MFTIQTHILGDLIFRMENGARKEARLLSLQQRSQAESATTLQGQMVGLATGLRTKGAAEDYRAAAGARGRERLLKEIDQGRQGVTESAAVRSGQQNLQDAVGAVRNEVIQEMVTAEDLARDLGMVREDIDYLRGRGLREIEIDGNPHEMTPQQLVEAIGGYVSELAQVTKDNDLDLRKGAPDLSEDNEL